MKCIKDKDGKVFVKEILIRKRLQPYFHKHLNKKRESSIMLGDLEHFERLRNYSFCRCIEVEEVKGAISSVHKGKTTRPNENLI